jgi:tRNA pseudouridine38-40 synthase
VLDVEEVPDSFHARKSAKAKTYAYSLWLSRKFVLPMRRRWVWPVGPLDVAAMDRAARHLAGRHDFAAFQNVGTDVAHTVRTIHSIRREPGGEITPGHLEMAWVFTADGFLKQMVRNLVGCLVEVGRGKLDPDAVPGLLESRDRAQAPATAPPQGLTMVDVAY